MNTKSSVTTWKIAGLVTGLLVGAAVALLLTPMSGTALMELFRERLRLARQEAQRAGKLAEEDVLERYQQLRNTALAAPGRQPLPPATAAAAATPVVR